MNTPETTVDRLRNGLLSIIDMAANDYDMTGDPGFEAIEKMAHKAVAAETQPPPPPETVEHLPDWLAMDMGLSVPASIPLPPEFPSSETVKDDPTVVMAECAECGCMWPDGETPYHRTDCGAETVPPPPEGPPNTLVREGDTTPKALPLVPLWGAPKKPKRRLPKKVRACIEAALKHADSKLREKGATAGTRNCSVDPAAQEAMRLYLDTWVAGPLKEVLKWDEGDDDFWTCWD
jgi:hypothetical protein